jgi:AcrR family transcriptional regulator
MARLPVTERRRRLLAAAFDVIARSGVAGVTTRAVVDEAGMKLASFHYAFSSREELLAELVVDVVANTGVVLEVAPVEGEGLESLLERGLRRYLDTVRENPARERAMFELTQYAMRTPGLAGLAARQYEAYRAFAAVSLEEAAFRTGCAWTRPVADVAADLVALTDGITLAWLAAAGPSVAPARRARLDPDEMGAVAGSAGADSDPHLDQFAGADARARRSIAFAARALAAEARPADPVTVDPVTVETADRVHAAASRAPASLDTTRPHRTGSRT